MIKNKKFLDDYYKKSGETTYKKNSDFIFENEHGFITFNVYADEGVMWVNDVYAPTTEDSKYWNDVVNLFCKCRGLKKIRFGTRRNPKAYERRWGFKLIGYVMEREVE